MATKEEIRPLYAELRGYLYEAPDGDKIRTIENPLVWSNFNHTVDELAQVTGSDYGRFKIEPQGEEDYPWVDVTTYRTQLSGLINRLHAEYFPDELSPFAGSPSMVISQTQQQSQAVHIQMIVEITEQLTQSEAKFAEGSKERKFIDRVKNSLKAVGSIAQLLVVLLKAAKDLGLSVDDLQQIFGG